MFTYLRTVHFLAHFFSSPDPLNPYVTIGLAIPDMHRQFTRVYNTSRLSQFIPTGEQQLAVHAGILAHYQQDAVFHELPVFSEWVQRVQQLYHQKAEGTLITRLFFLAHLGVEMLIDRAIVMQYPHYPDLFYRHLQQVSDKEILLYFNQLAVPASGLIVQQQITRFLDHRFLYYFQSFDDMMEGLFRVYRNVTGQFPEKEVRYVLHAVFSELDQEMMRCYTAFLSPIQSFFHAR